MAHLKLLSPAKLNLFLKVRNKRPDGFHNIETLFERISLCDELTFEPLRSDRVRIVCSHPDVPVDGRNLVYRAAKILKDEYGVNKGVCIRLKKRIPVAAGLGGGSSNAAIALLGLNKLWRLRISPYKLRSYASQIGSDVPFFLYNTSWAVATGRGEKIKKLNLRRKLWHIIVTPRRKLYASKVYGALNLKLTKKRVGVNILIHNLRYSNISNSARYLTNDLESPAFRLCPSLKKLQERLKLLNLEGVMVSGSGPSIFGITTSQKEAERLSKSLKRRYRQVFVVCTI